MPYPSTSIATKRNDLEDSLQEFDLEANAAGMIANVLFPPFPVQIKAGVFHQIPLEQLLANAETARSPGSSYNRVNWKFEQSSYACQEHGIEEPVDDDEKEMYADSFDAELISTQRARNIILSNHETRMVALVAALSGTAAANGWNAAATGLPVTDVEASVLRVYAASGLWPNTLAVNKKMFRALRNNDQVRDRIASSGAGDPTKASDVSVAMLSAVFDLNVVVAGGTTNSAAKGATPVPGQLWADATALVCRTAEGNDIRQPCFGRTFNWTGTGGVASGLVESYRDETVRSDIVRVRHDVQQKTLITGAADKITSVWV